MENPESSPPPGGFLDIPDGNGAYDRDMDLSIELHCVGDRGKGQCNDQLPPVAGCEASYSAPLPSVECVPGPSGQCVGDRDNGQHNDQLPPVAGCEASYSAPLPSVECVPGPSGQCQIQADCQAAVGQAAKRSTHIPLSLVECGHALSRSAAGSIHQNTTRHLRTMSDDRRRVCFDTENDSRPLLQSAADGSSGRKRHRSGQTSPSKEGNELKKRVAENIVVSAVGVRQTVGKKADSSHQNTDSVAANAANGVSVSTSNGQSHSILAGGRAIIKRVTESVAQVVQNTVEKLTPSPKRKTDENSRVLEGALVMDLNSDVASASDEGPITLNSVKENEAQSEQSPNVTTRQNANSEQSGTAAVKATTSQTPDLGAEAISTPGPGEGKAPQTERPPLKNLAAVVSTAVVFDDGKSRVVDSYSKAAATPPKTGSKIAASAPAPTPKVVVSATSRKAEKTDDRARRTVFVAGRSGVHAPSAFGYKQHQNFKAAILNIVKEVDVIDMKKHAMRIVCKSEAQVDILLKQETFLNRAVVVSRPYSLTKDDRDKSRKTWSKGVLKSVPADVDNAFIQKETGAVWVHRIARRTKEGTLANTLAVIVAFEQSLPETLKIGLRVFKVQKYQPKPTRCMRCQAYSHKKSQCHAQFPKCPKCAGDHEFSACKSLERQCANCAGPHTAGYGGCEAYQMAIRTLVVADRDGVNLKKASKIAAIEKRKATAVAKIRNAVSKPESQPNAAPPPVPIANRFDPLSNDEARRKAKNRRKKEARKRKSAAKKAGAVAVSDQTSDMAVDESSPETPPNAKVVTKTKGKSPNAAKNWQKKEEKRAAKLAAAADNGSTASGSNVNAATVDLTAPQNLLDTLRKVKKSVTDKFKSGGSAKVVKDGTAASQPVDNTTEATTPTPSGQTTKVTKGQTKKSAKHKKRNRRRRWPQNKIMANSDTAPDGDEVEGDQVGVGAPTGPLTRDWAVENKIAVMGNVLEELRFSCVALSSFAFVVSEKLFASVEDKQQLHDVREFLMGFRKKLDNLPILGKGAEGQTSTHTGQTKPTNPHEEGTEDGMSGTEQTTNRSMAPMEVTEEVDTPARPLTGLAGGETNSDSTGKCQGDDGQKPTTLNGM